MVRDMTAPADRHQAQRHPRHSRRDRWRLRRQDHRLSRAAGAGAGQEVGPAGEDGDEPRGGVPLHGPDLGLAPARSRSAPRRTARSSAAKATYRLQAGAFPGSPIRGAVGCSLSPYDVAERAAHGLRRGDEPAQGRGLSRAGRADRRLLPWSACWTSWPSSPEAWTRWSCARRTRPRRAPRRPTGPTFRPHRLPGDGRGGTRPSALQGAARAQPGPRRRLRLLVQRRRRIERQRQRQRGRHGRGDDRPSRHRRLARLAWPTSSPSCSASTTARSRC